MAVAALSPDNAADPAASLIAGLYAVDLAHRLPEAGGGLASFAVTGHPDLMAVQVQRRLPARAQVLKELTFRLDGMLCPIAHGVWGPPGSRREYYVICPAPPGPPLVNGLRPWREVEILDLVLRPAAHALDALHTAGMTHRAIRPDNVFHVGKTGTGRKLVLGSAWASPSAALQPVVFEPPDSAMCLPAGRGDGMPADDIYSLGVLLLTLTLGRVPLSGLDDETVLRRKLEFGSYAALAADERITPAIAELVRGMLAEDPEHRPSAGLLLDPPAARARRLAARPARRAQRPLEIGAEQIWDARQAASLLASDPVQAVPILRNGRMDHWLRHGLGDAGLAGRLEEVVRYRGGEVTLADPVSDGLLAMRCVAVLDPLAPLCWQGTTLWPDGIGPALAAADLADPTGSTPDIAERLSALIAVEAMGTWAGMRPERCDVGLLRMEARHMHASLRLTAKGGGIRRLRYQLNPLLSCSSPLVESACVTGLADLLPALDALAGMDGRPMDAEIAAFIAARGERRLDGEVAALSESDADIPGALAQLRLFAQLQNRFYPRPLPGLAAWLARRSGALASVWYNRDRRSGIAEKLHSLAADGMIGSMLELIEDRTARATDRREAQNAVDAVTGIDLALERMRTGATGRTEMAHRLGQEIAAGAGLTALAAVLTLAALG